MLVMQSGALVRTENFPAASVVHTLLYTSHVSGEMLQCTFLYFLAEKGCD